MNYLLFIVLLCIGPANSILNKKFQMGFKNDTIHFVQYNLVNAFFGTVIFLILSGFNISINMPTFIYSIIFSLIVVLSLCNNILMLSTNSIYVSGVTSSAGSLIITTIFGILFFNEPWSARTFVPLILMFFAAIIPYFRKRTTFTKNQFLICLLSFMLAGWSPVISKFYALDPDVCDTTSWFFLTNALIFIFCGIFLVFYSAKHKSFTFDLNFKQAANIFARTLLSNISSLLTVVVLGWMDFLFYTIVSSAFGKISSFILSKYCFKEHTTIETYISLVLAITAIVVKTFA